MRGSPDFQTFDASPGFTGIVHGVNDQNSTDGLFKRSFIADCGNSLWQVAGWRALFKQWWSVIRAIVQLVQLDDPFDLFRGYSFSISTICLKSLKLEGVSVLQHANYWSALLHKEPISWKKQQDKWWDTFACTLQYQEMVIRADRRKEHNRMVSESGGRKICVTHEKNKSRTKKKNKEKGRQKTPTLGMLVA